MSASKELDDFRLHWRQELQSQKTEQGALSADVSSTSSDQGKSSQSQDNSVHPFDSINRAKRKKNTLQPFLIAETLLKGDDAKEYLATGPSTASSSATEDDQSPIKRLRSRSGAPGCEGIPFENSREPTKQRFLDIFLQDLNEINEIPFFDISLPREVAIKMFQHLDAVDLCRCAQVSTAWKSLAEDELLWCRICHQLGYDEDTATTDNTNWKDTVQRHVSRERCLQSNWKNRTGRFRELQYVAGGVLTAADTWGSTVLAGYTNGQVRLWDLDDAYERTFTPSSRALVLDEGTDLGTVPVYPKSVTVNDVFCAGGYSQGLVDIWKIEGDTTPVHSFDCRQPISAVCWSPSEPTLAVSHGNHVRVEAWDSVTTSFQKIDDIIFGPEVIKMAFVPKGSQTSKRSKSSMLVVAAGDQVRVHDPGGDHVAVLHQVIGSTVSCIDCDMDHVAVGMTYYEMSETYKDKVKLYCLHTGRELLELKGHTWTVNCVNLRDSPQHRVVTGSGDKKVRVFDLRLEDPVLVLPGHAAPVSCVQMDDWKIVSGATDGLLCVWDQRMAAKLWDMHNRHAVRHLHFRNQLLVTANVPQQSHAMDLDEFDSMAHRRYRGSLLAYDFSTTQETEGVPSVCLSTYDEPESYNYNIRLAMPYDKV